MRKDRRYEENESERFECVQEFFPFFNGTGKASFSIEGVLKMPEFVMGLSRTYILQNILKTKHLYIQGTLYKYKGDKRNE